MYLHNNIIFTLIEQIISIYNITQKLNYNEKKISNKDEKLFTGDIPWVEKYRPQKLDDVIEHKEIIQILKKTIETGELPHLLLYGPPGTGKTTTAVEIVLEWLR